MSKIAGSLLLAASALAVSTTRAEAASVSARAGLLTLDAIVQNGPGDTVPRPAGATPQSVPQRTPVPKPAEPVPQERRDPNDHTARPHDAEIKKLVIEERKHRERLAKIWQLHNLAESKGMTERVGAIYKLLQMENTRYNARLAEAHNALGDREFAAVQSKLEGGRRGDIKKLIEKGQPPPNAPARGNAPINGGNGGNGGEAQKQREQPQREKPVDQKPKEEGNRQKPRG